ncbi:MAG: VWA domain-containing protein [Acidimicrobiia bacterium]|nr:VWA domain-containing protein [Acidimicrobiia bacterium]
MTTGTVLAGVDRAAFVVALAQRLRGAGVPVSLAAIEACTGALGTCRLDRRSRLYWLTRTTLVHDQPDVERFDRVFAAVFDDAVLGVDPHARRTPIAPGREDDHLVSVPGAESPPEEGAGLPWATRPAVIRRSDADDADDEGVAVPMPLPSDLARIAEVPFDELDPAELRSLDRLFAAAWAQWPQRRSRRTARHPTGARLDLRRTLARARRTGWEPIDLVRHSPVLRPRRLVMVCDVSQSMQPHTTAYLHLMRAAVLRADAEVFAFATSLTRLTPVLAHRDVDAAVAHATAAVDDRFGGTRIAANVRALLRSRHGEATRGAIIVIASDGWDADPPQELAAAMARLARRAHRVLWLNPRAATPGFEPRAGAMAAALPYCDELVAGDRPATLLAALTAR